MSSIAALIDFSAHGYPFPTTPMTSKTMLPSSTALKTAGRLPFAPTQLYLEHLSHFRLQVLIVSRAVYLQWHNIVPTADIHPARRLLLDPYLKLMEGQYFHRTRPWVLDNLRDLDCGAYVAALLQQGANLYEEFRLWVLEWPAKAVMIGVWSGLSDDVIYDASICKKERGNILEIIPPQFLSIVFVPKKRCILAICLWVEYPPDAVWLILDEESGGRDELDGIDDDHSDFIQWLSFMWMSFRTMFSFRDKDDMFAAFDIPAPPWHLKDTPPL
ncbi:hypothetical protein M422DRAFT_264107 [Sphaerobolus stellatus SS14]|uniref:Uncharacterized protein n=1 Tax=Sphaerobolus stellatus (strain SS14) TaxID=990650 RepID=A0A0C9UX05_SPHS4|nr:hypothetical protein M422DRAFT_264107 [Sphaerobolus stellatus SS14]